jgi:hypothetical protein
MSIRLSTVNFTQNQITTGAQQLSSLSVLGNILTDGDLMISTNKFTVTATTGNVATQGTLSVGGATTLVGTTGISGDFYVNTNKFIVNAATGDVTIGGTLSVASGFALSSISVAIISTNELYTNNIVLDTNKFIVSGSTGNTQIAGTLSVGGAMTVLGMLSANGGINIDTGRFTVDGANTGNVTTQGTLSVGGATTLVGNTGVTGTLSVGGAMTVLGMLSANGGINIDTGKFTVDGANTGNVATQGTLQFLSSNGLGYLEFRMDGGQYTGGGTSGTYTIPFTRRFPTAPYVIATPLSDTTSARVVWIRTTTISNFTCQVEDTAGGTVNTAYINWIAFG